jgi:hypothetical protein
VIAQAWRDGSRQARLARALHQCDEVALEDRLARSAGVLCGKASTADVIDASVALVAAAASHHGPVAVLTSDMEDIRTLLDELNLTASVRLIDV